MPGVTRRIRYDRRPMTAIVLAGGKSSRMGRDKAGLAIGPRTLIEHVLAQLEPRFDEVVVSVSKGQSLPPGALRPDCRPQAPIGERVAGAARLVRADRVRVVEDDLIGLGPLVGIRAGLRAAANQSCAVFACDIPEIDFTQLRLLVRAAVRQGAEIAVPRGPSGRFEPLFAVYRKSVVPAIDALLAEETRTVISLFDRCRTTVVQLQDDRWLRNINTPSDYRSYLNSLFD